jgi:5-formyltetrahydrofolate cyclo-ligase
LLDSVTAQHDRSRLRRDIRRARRALGADQRAAAEKLISLRIQTLGAYRRARTLSVFLAFDGEPSLERLIEAALRQGKRVFAPVLLKSGMRFAPFGDGPLRRRNFFGIDEPAPERLVDARALDLVLTPLVSFDSRGVRLGMGRGYYDRAFRFLRHRNHWSRPKLLGVAFSFQQVPVLERQPWDIPLWGTVTETRFHRFTAALQ